MKLRLVLILAAAALVLQDISAASINAPNLKKNVRTKPKHSILRKCYISKRPTQMLTHFPGTVVELKCEAVGNPAPSVQWYKNDVPITQYDQEANELVHSSTTSVGTLVSSLLITRPSENDEDIYTCLFTAGKKTAMASSIVRTDKSSSDLSERVKLLPIKPYITVHYDLFMDNIGSKIKIPCRVRGHPRPLVQWYDNNNELITDENNNMKVLRSGDLSIDNLRWSDMGEYTCRAYNEFGSDQKNTFVYPIKAG